MSDIRCIVRYFDFGGYYSDDVDDGVRWNPKEAQVYALVMKASSIENVTYSELVEKICRKIRVDEAATTRLKISYIPFLVVPKRPSHILDDDDVLGYLMEMSKDECKPVLHVELIEDSEQDRRSEAGVSNKEMMFSSGGADDGINGEPLEQYYELLDNVVVTDGKNVSCQEFANVDNSGMSEDIELTPAVEGDQDVNREWEDGIGLTLGQEFESKQEVQDLVDKASLENCFQVAIMHSDPGRYLLKCGAGLKEGCKWSLRVAKTKNSDYFSVRTYNKMHTCSRVTSSKSRNTRKYTPRLVASILHEEYPCRSDIPSPKNIIDIVERRFGVRVSYATALRGKKQAIKDVRDAQKGDPSP